MISHDQTYLAVIICYNPNSVVTTIPLTRAQTNILSGFHKDSYNNKGDPISTVTNYDITGQHT